MKDLPKVTPTQLQILLLIYKFRFISTKHIQVVLGHKNPVRILSWLKDLIEKKCVGRIYERKIFGENTKPAIYFLSTNGRSILKDHKDCDLNELKKVYKAKSRSQKFINRCLALSDIYIFFLSHKQKGEELFYFTKSNLGKFKHFPEFIDSYIALKTQSNTKRYFLIFFDEYTPPFIMRKRIKEYIEYSESGTWEAKTDSSLPPIFLVFPNSRMQTHIYYYSQGVLKKTFNDKVTFYLSTKDKLAVNQISGAIWQVVK